MPVVAPENVFDDVALVVAFALVAPQKLFGNVAPVVVAPPAFDAPVLVFAPALATIVFGDNALAIAAVAVAILWNYWNVLVPAELADISDFLPHCHVEN